MAYDELEPFGPRRAEQQAGMLCSVVANGLGLKRKGGGKRAWRPADFFATLADHAPAEQGLEAQVLAVEMLAARWGGRFTRGDGGIQA